MKRKLNVIKEVQPYSRGKRRYGAIYEHPSGERIYLAHRKHREIFRDRHKTISDAMRAGVASWAIDEETLFAMRSKGVKFVGVIETDTGDLYLTKLDHYMDIRIAPARNYTHSGGALQRYMPLQRFKKSAGAISLSLSL